MLSKSKISVITATFNAEENLSHLIYSLENQTYKNFEWIVADGGADPRKGWGLLQQALEIIAKQKSNIECIIFGQSAPANLPNLGFPLHWMRLVSDDVTLALLYSSTDVMVVPSRQESLPQSATEAQACGCAVVAFNCTGLPDVVEHKQTGYLVKPYSVEDLADGILWVLHDANQYLHIAKRARERTLNLWSYEAVTIKYLEAYSDVLNVQS